MLRKDEALAHPLNSEWLRYEMVNGVGVWWCTACHDHPREASKKDNLATKKEPVNRYSRFKEHREHENHVAVMAKILYDQNEKNHITNHITVTPINVLLRRSIESLGWLVEHKLANHLLLPSLELQHCNGAIVSFDHCHHESVALLLTIAVPIFKAMQLEDAVPAFMRVLFPHGVPYSWILDGTVDASKREVEVMEIILMSKSGKPAEFFGDLFELDLSKSRDGRSPDALAIYTGAKETLKARREIPAEAACMQVGKHVLPAKCPNLITNNKFEDGMVVGCFDGATVMQGGGGGGVADLMVEDAEQSKATWSAAHINQLAHGDSFEGDPYYFEFRRIVNAILAHYSLSAKSKASIDRITQELTGKHQVRRLGTLHGIRWAEAVSRAIDALFSELPEVTMDLMADAQRLFDDECLTAISCSTLFLGKKFDQQVNVDGTMKSRRFTCVEVEPDQTKLRHNDVLVCTAANGAFTEKLSKSELASILQAGCSAATWEPCAKCEQPGARKCGKCKGHDLFVLAQDASSLRFV